MVRDSIKQVWRPFIPKAVLAARRRIRARLASHWQSPAEMFGRIYRDRLWGRNGLDFFSGLGSHDPAVVEPYVAAVRSLLSGIRPPPVVVDIGCGDFAVGSRLTDLARLTVACDVVPQLIVRNRV